MAGYRCLHLDQFNLNWYYSKKKTRQGDLVPYLIILNSYYNLANFCGTTTFKTAARSKWLNATKMPQSVTRHKPVVTII